VRCVLGWGLACYVAWQLAFSGVRYDPEYSCRRDLLTARIAEDPDRPLLLLIGSSRTLMAFCPEALPPLRTPAGQQVLTFNFSHPAAGPIMNLVEVHRLLGEGVRPDWLVVEMMPAFLAGESFIGLTYGLGPGDLSVLQHYVNPWRLYGCFALQRAVTEHRHQLDFVRRHGLAWFLGEGGRPRIDLKPLGGMFLDEQIDPAERSRRTEVMRSQYAATLQDYELDPAADRAAHALLDLCRLEHIRPVLLLTPESSAFRSWYTPRALTTLYQYLDRLSREYDAPLIDARTWLADGDFTDGHHVLRGGAVAFTRRLAREVLGPLVACKLSGPPWSCY
jgi:hypothetical protein